MMQADKPQFCERELNLATIVQLLWKKIWIIIACGAVVAIMMYVYTLFFVTPRYSAYVTLYANNRNSPQGSTSITTADMNASAKLVDVYSAIIISDPVLDQVITENNLKMTISGLAQSISIFSVNETEVFRVVVTTDNPKNAAAIANSIAKIAPEKIGEVVNGCSIKIISNAKIPVNAVYPDRTSFVKRGFLIGVVISVIVLLGYALLDTRIKTETDLRAWNFPIIGSIPAFDDAEKSYGYGYQIRGDEK